MLRSYAEFIAKDMHRNETELCRIMNRHGSDKSPISMKHHNFSAFYQHLFAPIRDTATHVFELGLGTNNPIIPSNMSSFPGAMPGGSLRGWRDFFTKAMIYGADIDQAILFQDDRIFTMYCDQTNPTVVRQMWKTHGRYFDVVIEDGLHTFEANRSFAINSIDWVKQGGFYIIEDIHYIYLDKYVDLIEELKQKCKSVDYLQIPYSNNPYDNNLIVCQK